MFKALLLAIALLPVIMGNEPNFTIPGGDKSTVLVTGKQAVEFSSIEKCVEAKVLIVIDGGNAECIVK